MGEQLTQAEILSSIKWDDNGLVPAIVQDAVSKEVLMMAYMNKASLQQSLESGETWFWSRSRQELWHKGATYGHTQSIRSIQYDCDADTLLVKVDQKGAACHTGRYTCFYRDLPLSNATQTQADAVNGSDRFGIINQIEATVASREAERPEGAYTTYLFEKGVDKILKKVGEEAAEVIIAAKNRDPVELSNEASDLLFHLLVLLREQKLPLDEVLEVLRQRHKL